VARLAQDQKHVRVVSKEHKLKVWQTHAHVNNPSKKHVSQHMIVLQDFQTDMRINNLG